CIYDVSCRTNRRRAWGVKVLRLWLEAHQCAILLVGHHINQTIGTLPHVPDALLEIREQRLAAGFVPVLIEDDPLEMSDTLNGAPKHRPDQHVVLPSGEAVAGVKRHTRGSDRRRPEHDRAGHAFGEIGDLRPGIIAPEAD